MSNDTSLWNMSCTGIFRKTKEVEQEQVEEQEEKEDVLLEGKEIVSFVTLQYLSRKRLFEIFSVTKALLSLRRRSMFFCCMKRRRSVFFCTSYEVAQYLKCEGGG